MTNDRSEPDSAPGDDEPYEYRGPLRPRWAARA